MLRLCMLSFNKMNAANACKTTLQCIIIDVLQVDDGLFACSGSIAVGTLRTEQRNVDRGTKRISVPVLTPCQRISVPQDQMKSPESAKSFMLYVPFRGI